MRQVAVVLLLVAGCDAADPAPGLPMTEEPAPGGPTAPSGPTAGGESPTSPGVSFPRPCPVMYDDDALRVFSIEIAPEEWAALEAEYAAAPLETPYHPLIAFRHLNDVRTDAMIRLRGNPQHWASQDKMQFQISFNEVDPDGRYAGLRKIVLDSAHYNRTHLRDRLAASIFHDLGLPYACANHAELWVNGAYYGLYTNLEKIDHEFLERNYADHDGLLYKKGQELQTHEDENPDQSRKDAFWATTDPGGVDALGDLDEMVAMWAVESIVPDADGYWAGGWNMYLYDHPTRGFLYIPYDFDLAFDAVPSSADPVLWHKDNERYNGRPHVEAVLSDPEWLPRFVLHVAAARRAYDPDVLVERIDRWAAQIRDSAMADPHAPWTFDEHLAAVARLKDYVHARASWLDAWSD